MKESRVGEQKASPARMVVVLEWFEEVKARVPTGKSGGGLSWGSQFGDITPESVTGIGHAG